MGLTWVREDTPVWDATKQSIVGGAPEGALEIPKLDLGALAPGEWFRAEDGGTTVGYGWMDCTWGDAEITLAVDPRRQGEGIGAFIVSHLEREAAARGVNYLYNAVRPTHPDRDRVTRWLESRGFAPSGDGLLKKRVQP
jgi:GNAT superfamily N-acetyltransferase